MRQSRTGSTAGTCALGPRFRGDERNGKYSPHSPLIPAHSRPKDGVLSHAYAGNPVLSLETAFCAGSPLSRGRAERKVLAKFSAHSRASGNPVLSLETAFCAGSPLSRGRAERKVLATFSAHSRA